MVQPASHTAPSTLENTPAHTAFKSAPSTTPSHNTSSKLSCFLKYAKQCLGIDGATGYKDSFHAYDYGPNILHLVEDTTLQWIGLSEGDIIHLQQVS